jgi:hypothetical protein
VHEHERHHIESRLICVMQIRRSKERKQSHITSLQVPIKMHYILAAFTQRALALAYRLSGTGARPLRDVLYELDCEFRARGEAKVGKVASAYVEKFDVGGYGRGRRVRQDIDE